MTTESTLLVRNASSAYYTVLYYQYSIVLISCTNIHNFGIQSTRKINVFVIWITCLPRPNISVETMLIFEEFYVFLIYICRAGIPTSWSILGYVGMKFAESMAITILSLIIVGGNYIKTDGRDKTLVFCYFDGMKLTIGCQTMTVFWTLLFTMTLGN